MKNNKKFLLIILGVILICGGIITAAAVNIDKIMMRLSPQTYISYMAMNTSSKIKEELEMIDEAMPHIPELSDSHMLTINFDSSKHKLRLTEDFNDEKPSVVFNGIYNGTDFDGYINNEETAVCLPSLLDVYFTFSTKNFGDDFINSGGNKLFPIGITEGMDLTLPSEKSDDDIISTSQLINLGKILISDVEIHHDAGDDYFLILKGENVKQAALEFLNILSSNQSFNNRLKPLNDSLQKDILNDAITSVQNAELDETIAVNYTQRKNYISRIKSDIRNGDTTFSINLDSNGARLLDDYSVSLKINANDTVVGIEYSESGNKMFRNEEKTDKRILNLMFGEDTALKLTSDFAIDQHNTAFNGNITVETPIFGDFKLNIPVEGQPIGGRTFDDSMMIKSQFINSDGETANISVELMPYGNLQPQNREKYPFKDLMSEDLSSLGEIIKMQKGA